MILKGSRKGTARFVLSPSGQARDVRLAGDFTGWQPVAMRKQRGGRFSVSVPLKHGTYEYRFIVDGQWQADPDNTHWAPNPFGSLNSVAEIA
jgi:1,4-alpha-glucan branching enzyme